MGLLSIIKKQKQRNHEIRVLVLGLDNAGKTTIVTSMLQMPTSEVSPTMGFEIKTVTVEDYTLNIWDIGGQVSLRSFWSNYFDKTDVVLWVIDGVSTERIQESFKELQEKVMNHDRFAGVCLGVLINKIDIVENLEALVRDVREALDIKLKGKEYITEIEHQPHRQSIREDTVIPTGKTNDNKMISEFEPNAPFSNDQISNSTISSSYCRQMGETGGYIENKLNEVTQNHKTVIDSKRTPKQMDNQHQTLFSNSLGSFDEMENTRFRIFTVSGKTGTGIPNVLKWVIAQEYY